MLSIEDGSIIEGASSYISLDDADAYCLPRSLWPETPVKTDEQGENLADAAMLARKEAALIRAFDWLNGLEWLGEPSLCLQLTAWPRMGIAIGADILPQDCIPQKLKFAQCEMAALIFAGYDPFKPMLRGGKVQSQSESISKGVDVLSKQESHSVSYAEDAPVETLLPAVIALIRPFLRTVPGESVKNAVREAGVAERFDYAEFLELAKEQIAECGCLMTYVKRRESGNIDARTGKRTVTESRIEFDGLITKPLATEVQAGRFQKAQMVILAAGDVTDRPDITDAIVCNGRE